MTMFKVWFDVDQTLTDDYGFTVVFLPLFVKIKEMGVTFLNLYTKGATAITLGMDFCSYVGTALDYLTPDEFLQVVDEMQGNETGSGIPVDLKNPEWISDDAVLVDDQVPAYRSITSVDFDKSRMYTPEELLSAIEDGSVEPIVIDGQLWIRRNA